MCQIESYRSSTCGHKWVTIVKRCGSPGTGFNKDNAVHSYTRARTGLLEPKYLSVAAGGCPNCDKRGNYDANETRMILGPDNIDARGTLGNGYSMTDGYGNVLPVSSGRPSRPYGHGYGPATNNNIQTACGGTGTSGRRRPSHGPGRGPGGCSLM